MFCNANEYKMMVHGLGPGQLYDVNNEIYVIVFVPGNLFKIV